MSGVTSRLPGGLLVDIVVEDVDMTEAVAVNHPTQPASSFPPLSHASTLTDFPVLQPATARASLLPADDILHPVIKHLEAVSLLAGAPRGPRSNVPHFRANNAANANPNGGNPFASRRDDHAATAPVSSNGNAIANNRIIKQLRTRNYRDFDRDRSNNRFLPGYEQFRQRIIHQTPYQPGQGGLHESRHKPAEGELIPTGIEDTMDNRHRGGRQYGGQAAGQKRRNRDDDEEDRPQMRRERQAPPSSRIRTKILTVAENPLVRPMDDVVGIAKFIIEFTDDEIFVRNTSSLLVQLIAEQPFKIPFIAAIVLYVNQLNKHEFAKTVLDKAAQKAQDAMANGQWRTFKLCLRFFACTQELLEGEGIFALLEELFNRAVDLQTASPDDTLGPELVKIIMLTIPYAMASSDTDLQTKAADLLLKTEIIASAPRETETVVDAYIRAEGMAAPEPLSYLVMLQRQLQGEADLQWPLKVIPRLFEPLKQEEEDLIDMGERGNAGIKHALPLMAVPETINPTPEPIFPELYFSVYADQEIETVPANTDIASSLIRDALVDTINILDFNRIEAARFLVNIDSYWAPDTFVRRSTPFDKLRDIPEGKSTWKPEDLAIDALFSQIMLLPAPEHKVVFYHSIITEACKLAPGAIAPSLGRAIRYIYRNLDMLDEELVYRFMDWFSHHLSNWDFRWKWQEWIGAVQEDILKPQKSFIVGALHKEMRLSFASRIRQTVPEEYHGIIPASMENEIPDFKFNNSLTPFSAEVKPLPKIIRKKGKEGEEAMDSALEALRSAVLSSGDSTPAELVLIDALITTICYVGSKSLSHVLSFIERNKTRLLAMSQSHPDAQAQIISSVIGYWEAVQPGVAVTIVDKLLNYSILDTSSVVEWTFAAPQMNGGRGLAYSWFFEMVSNTVNKVTNRLRQIVKARLRPDLKPSVAAELEATLAVEREATRQLFALIDDALKGVAEGINDTMLEGGEGMTEDDEDTRFQMRLWGVKWRRVFARKAAVEETRCVEAAKCMPAPREAEDEDMGVAANGNGENGAVNGNGVAAMQQDDDLIE